MKEVLLMSTQNIILHYENTPIQIHCTLKILQPKKENFQIKHSDIFIFLFKT